MIVRGSCEYGTRRSRLEYAVSSLDAYEALASFTEIPIQCQHCRLNLNISRHVETFDSIGIIP